MSYRFRDRKRPRNPLKSSRIEREYAGQLRLVAQMVGSICSGYDVDDPLSYLSIASSLRIYSDALDAWAKRQAERMVGEIARADERAWRERSALIGEELRKEILSAPTGEAFRALQAEQVKLIKSLPLEAAERVRRLAMQGMTEGTRPAELAAEILRTGDVTASRARLIARTETSRAASNLTQARAEYAGSEGYIWRTSGDSDVRDSHRDMNGQYVRWDSPPTLDGMTGHAGCLPNCRCFAVPVLPE